MKVRPKEKETRNWVDGICILNGTLEPILAGKEFDTRFFIGRDSEIQMKGEVGGDSTEY